MVYTGIRQFNPIYIYSIEISLKDICGIICAVMTWLLIAYAEFVVMKVILWPSTKYPIYRIVNMIVFNFGIFLAVSSHLKSMFSDPGAVPKGKLVHLYSIYASYYKFKGNATKENIQQMGFREGEIIFKCPKCSSIKPNRAHHCSVCKR